MYNSSFPFSIHEMNRGKGNVGWKSTRQQTKYQKQAI